MVNETTFKVHDIRSYQTLVYKNGYRTFAKPEYQHYKLELSSGARKLRKVRRGTAQRCDIRFNVKEGVEPQEYHLKMKTTGNTWRKYLTEAEALEKYKPDRHDLIMVDSVIKFGAVGDNDNVMKPIIDYLEEAGIISNDRNIVQTWVEKTFGNKENTIDLKLTELETVVDDDGRHSFKQAQ